MEFENLDNSPSALRAFLEAEGLALKKRWGQNFMVSPGARRRISDTLDPGGSDTVWEVGPGIGSITAALAPAAGALTVFEIDHGLIRVLRRRFGDSITIVPGDAVKTLPQQLGAGAPDLFCGNLPYSSAAAIISVLLETGAGSGGCRRLVATVQREVAGRMVAAPGSKAYSPLTVLCSLSGVPRHVMDLAAGSFYPPPGVVSAVVAIELSAVDPARLALATLCSRSLFADRRKTVRNNLKRLAGTLDLPPDYLESVLTRVGVDPGVRAEVLEPEAFLAVADLLRPDYSGRT
jgi:16S rRNA (adenine1518-N6/adenine1519-N6)-dimethyltransferase